MIDATKTATIEKMDIDTFLSLPPVHCQRNHELRKKTVKPLLENYRPTHIEVAIGEYPSGRRVVLNGNTRAAIWKDEEDLRPEYVMASIYPVSDDDYAKDLYSMFDSEKAVEKSPDKVQGIYRSFGYSFSDKKILRGGIIKALEYASKNNPACDFTTNLWQVVPYFRDELRILDKNGISTIMDQSIICAFLIAFKYYGNNPQLESALLKFKNGEQTYFKDDMRDAISVLHTEWITDDRWIGKKGTNGVQMPVQVGFALYCIDKWMSKEPMSVNRKPTPNRKTFEEAMTEYYNNYWNNEQEEN